MHEEYVRIGTYTKKLKDYPAKEAKIWKGGQKSIEGFVLKKGLSSAEVLSLLSAETYFDMRGLPLPQNISGIMERFISEHILKQDEIGYSITELGAILFAKKLSEFDNLKRKIIRVIVYNGKNKINTIREQSFDKGYAICFKEMLAWINSQLPANEEIGQALRKDARMYPELAVREIVANAIIHQDFAEQGFPMVEIYQDRIEISNPGQPMISVERFIDEYQSRNDSMADLMRRIGICEEKVAAWIRRYFVLNYINYLHYAFRCKKTGRLLRLMHIGSLLI